MQKTIISFFLSVIFGVSMAQNVQTYSVYDTNQSGDLNVSDVTTVVDNVKKSVEAAGTQQYVTAEDLSLILKGIKDDLKLIKEKLGIEASETPQNPDEPSDAHQYVDLGLSVKWATCNVGATNPEDYGDYFVWGDVIPYYAEGYSTDNPCKEWIEDKTSYDWSNLKYCSGNSYNGPFTKYVTNSSYGEVDNIKTLELADDAARANWGGNWRMPTDGELTELRTECTWTWTKKNDVDGYEVKSKTNGNSIFLPAAGCRFNKNFGYGGTEGYYWSSSLHETTSSKAYYVKFTSTNIKIELEDRCDGQSVRAVCP